MRGRCFLKLLYVAFAAAVVSLTPIICLALDGDHLVTHPDCPLCNLLVVFVAIVVCLACFIFAQGQARTFPVRAARRRLHVYAGGPSSVRDPPLASPSRPA